MSSVRRKPAKALLCLVLALSVAAVFLLSSSAVFAQTNSDPAEKITGTFKTSGILNERRLTGTIKVNPSAITYSKENNQISLNVDATDLFNEADKEYQDHYKHDLFSSYYTHIVMYGENSGFPVFTYTVKFPEGVTVDDNKVTYSVKSTSTISNITVKNDNKNTLTFTFYLGSWWDYAEFFTHVENELKDGRQAHPIQVTIPVSGSLTSGSVTGSGSCKLYKNGKHPVADPIVNITSPDTTWTF
jgi:hypothetical protein